MNIPRLQMKGVRKAFGPTIALAGVDMAVNAGEIHALIGENGAGKSTLMKVLSGAYRSDEGQMWLDGVEYVPRNPADGRTAGIAMIYQDLSLAPDLTVAENILLGIEPTCGPIIRRGEVKRRAAEALARLGHEGIPVDIPVARLSVAEQQLVEIARSIATGCRVLVLDEPTSSLAREDIDRLFALIRRLKRNGIAVVYISHFLEEVREISERFTVLRDGNTVGSSATSDVPTPEIIRMMVGREVKNLYPHSPRTPGETLLEIRDLAGIKAPESVSLILHRGEVMGIAGLVGAGRTEFLRALFGLDPVQDGSIKLMTWSGAATPATRWLQGMGMVSEDRNGEGLAASMSVADNLTLPRLPGLGSFSFVTPHFQNRTARRWISDLSIRCPSPRQRIAELSGGNQQKVAVARLLHADVDVLLLDEPTRGIDVGSKAQIYRIVNKLASGDPVSGTRPKAILMVSSYLPELMGVCDRIAVMCRGRLGPARPVKQLDEHRIMLAATGTGE